MDKSRVTYYSQAVAWEKEPLANNEIKSLLVESLLLFIEKEMTFEDVWQYTQAIMKYHKNALPSDVVKGIRMLNDLRNSVMTNRKPGYTRALEEPITDILLSLVKTPPIDIVYETSRS
ncbi:MAG: hypothetical protein AAB553_01040 [Patescibacteria group bacterium]